MRLDVRTADNVGRDPGDDDADRGRQGQGQEEGRKPQVHGGAEKMAIYWEEKVWKGKITGCV